MRACSAMASTSECTQKRHSTRPSKRFRCSRCGECMTRLQCRCHNRKHGGSARYDSRLLPLHSTGRWPSASNLLHHRDQQSSKVILTATMAEKHKQPTVANPPTRPHPPPLSSHPSLLCSIKPSFGAIMAMLRSEQRLIIGFQQWYPRSVPAEQTTAKLLGLVDGA
jgi:hypothetical protein